MSGLYPEHGIYELTLHLINNAEINQLTEINATKINANFFTVYFL